MGHVTTLVALRLRLGLREASGQRGVMLGVLAAAPGLVLGTLVMMVFVFAGTRALAGARPEALAPVASALATLLGLLAVVAPLAGGVAATDMPDVRRLRHFPVRRRDLVIAHLLTTLSHPLILLQGLLPVAAAAGLARSWAGFVAALAGFAASWATIVAGGQIAQMALTLWANQPRRRDWALLAGAPIGIAVGLLPFLLLGLGPDRVLGIYTLVVHNDPFALSPLGWGARAAVYGAQGSTAAWGLALALGIGALAAAVGVAAALAGRLSRTETTQGRSRLGGRGLWASSAIGCLIEKDLRLAWRDPALRISLAMGLIGPLIILVLLSRGGAGLSAGSGAVLGVFLGLTTSGMNVFALERRAVPLLLAFPVPRWQILTAKNVLQVLLRSPTIIGFLVAIALIGSPAAAGRAAMVALCVWLVGAGADAVVSVLHPHAFPPPGASPTAHRSGASGLAAAGWALARVAFVLATSTPLVILANLPWLLEAPHLRWIAVPLAVAGAAAVHALLVGLGERLLVGREASLIARALGNG